jgi:L-threonylcarbamoyladenylate synthase
MSIVLPVAEAARALCRGAVIAYPTEAVWGLGCNPLDEAAVRRLLALKQRPVDKGLILVAANVRQLDGLADWTVLPADRRDVVLASWPGPHTWIIPATAAVPAWITGAHGGVAMRVSAHPVVVALCEAFGGPLVSTSANPAAAPPPRSLEAMDAGLRAALDGLVVGEVGGAERPTDIVDAASGRTLRA